MLIQKKQWQNSAILIIFFIYITFVYVASDKFFVIDRFFSIGGAYPTAFGYCSKFLFIFEYFLAISALVCATRLPNKLLGNSLITIVCFFIFLDIAAFNVYGRPADIFNIAMLNAAVANTKDALFEYGKPILKALFFTILIYIPLILFSFRFTEKGGRSLRKVFLVMLMGLLTIYTSTLIIKGAPALVGFPKGFSYIFASLSIKLNSLISPLNHKQIEELTSPVTNDKFNNIIVVIDESVEYNKYLEVKKQWQKENNRLLGGGKLC